MTIITQKHNENFSWSKSWLDENGQTLPASMYEFSDGFSFLKVLQEKAQYFSGLVIQNLTVIRADLTQLELFGIQFRNCKFIDCNFHYLQAIHFERCKFSNCRFVTSNNGAERPAVEGCIFSFCKFFHVEFNGLAFRAGKVIGCLVGGNRNAEIEFVDTVVDSFGAMDSCKDIHGNWVPSEAGITLIAATGISTNKKAVAFLFKALKGYKNLRQHTFETVEDFNADLVSEGAFITENVK